MKWLLFPLLIAIACLVAGLYGALHNQISYTVALEYFHVLKFPQFGIPADLHNRLGAAVVGVAASWWMGLVIGVPVMALGLRIQGNARYFRTGMRAIGLVIGISAICAITTLGLLTLIATPELAAQFNLPPSVTDRVAFLRAGAMHEGSYAGGLLGLLAALFYTYRVGRKAGMGQ